MGVLATWLAAVLAAPGTQGSWLGQQEIQCSRRAWHSMEKEMATHSSILAWRIPLAGHSPQDWKVLGMTEASPWAKTQGFLPIAVLPQ